jgi:hypothetical protein
VAFAVGLDVVHDTGTLGEERFDPPRLGYYIGEMLKSAWEIALEKNEKYEELSDVTAELLDHVALLEEGWRAIRAPERDAPAERGHDRRRLAA